jgi:hypothetical protein
MVALLRVMVVFSLEAATYLFGQLPEVLHALLFRRAVLAT